MFVLIHLRHGDRDDMTFSLPELRSLLERFRLFILLLNRLVSNQFYHFSFTMTIGSLLLLAIHDTLNNAILFIDNLIIKYYKTSIIMGMCIL